jgi:hypothetical protein
MVPLASAGYGRGYRTGWKVLLFCGQEARATTKAKCGGSSPSASLRVSSTSKTGNGKITDNGKSNDYSNSKADAYGMTSKNGKSKYNCNCGVLGQVWRRG